MVYWREEDAGLVGYVDWSNDAKLERLVVLKDKPIVQFTLFLTDRAATAELKVSPESTVSDPARTVAVPPSGKFEVRYSNGNRRDYLFDAGKVTLIASTKTAPCGNCGNAVAGQPFVEGQCRFCWQALNDPRYAKLYRGTELFSSQPEFSTVSWHQENGRLISYLYWQSLKTVERVVVQADGRIQFSLFSNNSSVGGESPKPINLSESRGDNPISSSPEKSGGPKDRDAALEGSPTTATTVESKPKKNAIPDEEALVVARTKLKATFGDIAKSKNLQEKMKLSMELLKVAQSEKDPVVRYALLDSSRRLAITAQDIPAALLVAEEIAKHFESDSSDEQMRTLTMASTTLMPTTGWEFASNAAAKLAKECLRSKRIDIADSASLLAVEFAAKGKNPEPRKQAKQCRDEILAFKKMSALAEEAEEVLKTMPDDSGANIVLARWHCFVLNDVGGSLRFWEKSGDAVLAKAATVQCDPRANGLEKGEAWLAAAERVPREDRIAVQRIAKSHFSAAAKELSGLDKLLAARREAELASTELSNSQSPDKTRTQQLSKLESGFIVRLLAGDKGQPTHVLGIVADSTDYQRLRISNRSYAELGDEGRECRPHAWGIIDLEKDALISFKLMNASCRIDGISIRESETSGTVSFEKKLAKGRHTVRITAHNPELSHVVFALTKASNGERCVSHFVEDLEKELSTPIRLSNGETKKGILLSDK